MEENRNKNKNQHKKKYKKSLMILISVIFWLVIWQIVSEKIGQEILLVSPVSSIERLVQLSQQKLFWMDIFNSSTRIIGGFVVGFVIATIMALLTTNIKYIREFVELPIQTVQTVPVVSFIILCLIWIKPKNLSFFISFLMALPIIYRNIVSGILSTPKELLDMAKVFKIGRLKKLRYIYLSQLKPHINSSVSVSIGLCWKAGIAAEVIAMPGNTIGENLYNAKVYLSTADLFAWTIVIIVLSVFFKKIILKLVDVSLNKLLT